MAEPCPFCAGPLAGNHSTFVLAQWSDAIAIEPLDPVTPGHFIVIPRAHVEDALADSIVTGATAQRAARMAAHLMADKDAAQFNAAIWRGRDEARADFYDGWAYAEGVNVITSVGAAATQSVPHLHWHVVPRRAADGLALPWTPRCTCPDGTVFGQIPGSVRYHNPACPVHGDAT